MSIAPNVLHERWNDRELIIAVSRAMEMFSHKRYADFLQQSGADCLTKEWFDWFVVTWTVARTVAKEKRDAVRRYLDTTFRLAVLADRDGTVVDEAANFIGRQGWGANEVQGGSSTAPVSLVSKIAFFLNPDTFIPFDSSALRGINELRRTKREGGQGRLNNPSYRAYLAAFDVVFKASDSQVSALLEEPWVKVVSKHMSVGAQSISRRGFRRKVVDNLLMQRGGRQFTADG